LTSEVLVADVGSGTGISTQPFLDAGNIVYAVEPNAEMRRAAERLLGHDPKFRSVAATAESTTLEPHSIDLVIAGQAFHWFDRAAARTEFSRILRPAGWVAIIWNERRVDTTPFLRAYEDLLHQHGTDYREVDHRQIGSAEMDQFLGPDNYTLARFENRQILDWSGLVGRLGSCSYVPHKGQPGYKPMLADLQSIFDAHQTAEGKVSMDYETLVYYGQLVQPTC
jgi:SAM-dependent methyltransferase